MYLSEIQIYLATHNRPDYVIYTIESILAQKYNNYILTISDNSTNNKTEEAVQQFIKKEKIKYIRRIPALTASDHSKAIYSEIYAETNSKYFVVFHDDDIMKENYFKNCSEFLDKNPSYAAVSCNCYYIDEKNKITSVAFASNSEIKTITDKNKLAIRYLNNLTVTPYPAYMYRKKLIKNLQPDDKYGGKHSDVSFLLDILERGKIAWIMEPLIEYRLHKQQDSKFISIRDKLSLLRYISLKTDIKYKSSETTAFRKIIWCDWLKYCYIEGIQKHHKRYIKIFMIMLPYLIKNKLRKLFLLK